MDTIPGLDNALTYGASTASPSEYYDAPRMLRVPTIAQRLELAVKNAEEKLASAKRAKEIFDKYPDIEELLNIMQRGHI